MSKYMKSFVWIAAMTLVSIAILAIPMFVWTAQIKANTPVEKPYRSEVVEALPEPQVHSVKVTTSENVVVVQVEGRAFVIGKNEVLFVRVTR